MTVESAPAPATGRHKQEEATGQSAKQRANAASVRPARPPPNKTLEPDPVAEAKAWSDAAAIRAYAAHLFGAALKGGGSMSPELFEWLAWANDVADRLDPAPGRLMKSAKREVGTDKN